MENTNKLTGKDLINVGIYSAMTLVIFFVVGLLTALPVVYPFLFRDLADCMRYPYDAVLHKNQEIWNAYHYRHHWRYLLLFNRLWLDRPARLGARRHSKRCCAQNRRLSESSKSLF